MPDAATPPSLEWSSKKRVQIFEPRVPAGYRSGIAYSGSTVRVAKIPRVEHHALQPRRRRREAHVYDSTEHAAKSTFKERDAAVSNTCTSAYDYPSVLHVVK